MSGKTLMERLPVEESAEHERVKFVWDCFEEAKLSKWKKWHKGHKLARWFDDLYDGCDIVSSEKFMPSPKENFIFEIVEAQTPLMLDQRISFEINADDPTDENAVEDAALVQDLLEDAADDIDLHREFRKFIKNVLKKGTGILKDWWNPSGKGGVGCVETKCVRLEHIFPDPFATDFDDATYVIYAHHADIDSLRCRYPEKREELRPNKDIDVTDEDEFEQDKGKSDRTILVLEMIIFDPIEVSLPGMESPTKKYPGGRVITVTENLVLRDIHTKNPYSRHPYSKAQCYDQDGFWGKGDVELLAPLQKELDRINAILLIHYLMSGGWLVLPQDTGIDERSLTNKPNGVLRPRDKTSGDGIRIVERPRVPVQLIERAALIKQAAKKLAGIDEISADLLKDRTHAASSLAIVKETSENRIRGKLENINRALNQWAWRVIRMIVNCSGGGFKVKKRDGTIKEVTLERLERIKNSGLLDNMNIKVNVVPTTAISRAIRLSQILELDKNAVILGDPVAQNFTRRLFIAEIADIPGLTKLIKDEQEAVKKIMEEQQAAAAEQAAAQASLPPPIDSAGAPVNEQMPQENEVIANAV